MSRPSSTLIGFLVMAFAVVGLSGIMASTTAPLPLARAIAREGALDEALAAAGSPDPQAAIEALRPRLGDSAAALLPAGPDLPARIAAERLAMRARFSAEAAAAATRMRWLVAVVTVMAAAFGVMLLQAARRAG